MTATANWLALAYVMGGIGILLEWRAYQREQARQFRRWSAAAAGFWALQYALLSAWTASLSMATTALRTLIAEYLHDSRQKHWFNFGFIGVFIGLNALSWQGFISLLPTFAASNTTIALFYLNNRNMRLSLLASSAAWILNDLYWQAWPALLAETVAVGINLHTIRKLPTLT